MPNGLITINVPSTSRLPDNAQWTNRFKIHSSTSNRVYTVAQNKTGRFFGCSCKGWIFNKHCKHLQSLGIPGNYQKVQVSIGPRPTLAFAPANA